MNCEFNYCIYNNNFYCILEKTHINQLSMCEDCIMVSIPDGLLKELKQTQLKEIENRLKNF